MISRIESSTEKKSGTIICCTKSKSRKRKFGIAYSAENLIFNHFFKLESKGFPIEDEVVQTLIHAQQGGMPTQVKNTKKSCCIM